MSREELKELYKAVKWEVKYFFADHGCNLVQMWQLVTGTYPNETDKQAHWWQDICLDDYRNQRM